MKTTQVWAVITTPSENLNNTFASWWEVVEGGGLRIAELLPVGHTDSISTIKNVASRVASRSHLMVKKGRWKQDLDIAIANGFDDYYIRYGTDFCVGMILELIIGGETWKIKDTAYLCLSRR